jgi:dihydrofolate synthase/folylpolyglutamate synthase
MDMIDWLYGLQHFGIKLGLDNIRALLRLLDHPESAYPSVLVAGTNGKGSVAAMVQAMLAASGRRAGLFTSPHLMKPNERIRIDGEDITDDELHGMLADMKRRIEAAHEDGRLETQPSFFELITATALEAFRRHGVDAALLEVGLGGRLDATNAVEADLSVIVSIDLDHTKTLGPTLGDIAGEKAGVIKHGRPVISGVVRQRALSVLQRICRERDAPFVDARLAVAFESERDGEFTLSTTKAVYHDLRLSLPGRHQIDNARVALATFELLAPRLGLEPDPDAVREGLSKVRWPGRLQWIRDRPGLPDMLLDGAHNPAGARTLANYLRTLDAPEPVAVFGVMQGKLLSSMLEPLSPLIHSAVITRPDVRRAADPYEVADIVRPHIDRVEVVPEPSRAVDRAAVLAGGQRFVLVTGSLYLVGEILCALEGRKTPGPISM